MTLNPLRKSAKIAPMLVKPAIRKVTRLGQPVLRKALRELTPKETQDPAVQRLIDEMVVTMIEYIGVGIAANQVGEDLSLFVMGLAEGSSRHEEGIELTVVFNPKIKPLGPADALDWEGCLSVPGLRGKVPRYHALELSGLDRKGKAFTKTYEGFPARVVQHETDHLNGKVYLDRMPDLTTLAYVDEHVRR
jgi:peptide deformylase